MSFESELGELGFDLVQSRRDGGKRFVRRANAYTSQWFMVNPDGSAEFTWEFELGAYLKAKGFDISVQDELSLLLFPGGESRGPADLSWLADRMTEADRALGSVDLSTGG